MKFIKSDGSIEEGTPLSESTSRLRDELEKYLHEVVCKSCYHSEYGSKKTCHTAANFLALAVNNNQDDPADYTFAVEAENLRLNPPEPEEKSLAEVAPGFASA
jgi:predicted nucleic-acid-binding Zn-ribbon protein